MAINVHESSYLEARNASLEFPSFGQTRQNLRNSILGAVSLRRTPDVPVPALSSISLQINSGDRLGVVGKNGSGKSTLLRVLAGIYPVTSGTVKINGQVSTLLDLELGVNPEATGEENIVLRSQLMGVSRRDLKLKYHEIIAFAGLGDFVSKPLRTYSSGMKLRLSFAISTAFEADILIMDEWLSVGDSEFVQKSERKLRELVNSSNILVIATHSEELLRSVCNRAILLDHGNLAMSGSVDKIAEHYFRNVPKK